MIVEGDIIIGTLVIYCIVITIMYGRLYRRFDEIKDDLKQKSYFLKRTTAANAEQLNSLTIQLSKKDETIQKLKSEILTTHYPSTSSPLEAIIFDDEEITDPNKTIEVD